MSILPIVIRRDDGLHLSVYDEKGSSLKELKEESFAYTGDYRECEVRFNPVAPTMFAHASTTHIRYTEVKAAADGFFSLHLLFEVALSTEVIVELQFSPHGRYLLAYALPDNKRTPNGNLFVIECETGKIIKQTRQARWPALVWTANEEYCVRIINNCLHVIRGEVGDSTTTEENVKGTGSEEGEETATSSGSGPLCKMDLRLPQDKEVIFSTSPKDALPLLAVFKPFHKQQPASLTVYRLPALLEPMYSLNFARAESASFFWSISGEYLAVMVMSERDKSGKSYYGVVKLHIVDVKNRSVSDIKLTGEGETVHYCEWSPVSDELLVVHGKMPRNKVTLFSKKGVALLTFGEAPRNMAAWSPNGKQIVMGGSGNLAGDYKFYALKPSQNAGAAPTAAVTGFFNEKCSFSTWAPDSYNFMCSNVFTKLRTDNKLSIFKRNGERVLCVKFNQLYGAHWVQMKKTADYELRDDEPAKAVDEAPKPQAYRPPGGTSRAAALLRRPEAGTEEVKAAGPPGAKVAEKKKRRR